MRILYYSLPCFASLGGMNIYVKDIVEREAKSNEVTFLYPGRYTFSKKTKIIKQKGLKLDHVTVYEIINPNWIAYKGIRDIDKFIQIGDKKIYEKFLTDQRPDIIHIHTLLGIQSSFLQSCKELNIKIIYTAHDYYGLCPKIDLYKGVVCKKGISEECFLCCKNGESIEEIRRRESKLNKWIWKNKTIRKIVLNSEFLTHKASVVINKKENLEKNVGIKKSERNYVELKKYFQIQFSYIDYFHFNSNQTKSEFLKYLYGINGEVIYLFHKNIADQRKRKKIKGNVQFGYMGRLQSNKGFFLLKDILDELYYKKEIRNFNLHIYTQLRQEADDYIIYHDPYDVKNISEVMYSLDLVIVPSLWKETWGFNVLEALSCGIPVLLTDYVAAKEIELQLEIKIDSVGPCKDELQRAIQKYLENPALLVEYNERICKAKNIFSYDEHVKKIEKMYEQVKRGKNEF